MTDEKSIHFEWSQTDWANKNWIWYCAASGSAVHGGKVVTWKCNLGYVKRFAQVVHGNVHFQWNAYDQRGYKDYGGKNYKYMCTAKTLEEIKAAFEVAMRIEQ